MSAPASNTPAHPWMPFSPCGTGCLPPRNSVPAVSWPRAMTRRVVALVVLLQAVGLVLLIPLLGKGRVRMRVERSWHSAMLRALGIRLDTDHDAVKRAVRGQAGEGGALVAVNHISWLDILAVNAVQPVRMLAKKDIEEWPVIGPMAAAAGTLFVDREHLSKLPETVATMAGAMREGALVGVFPEGTTWCGLASGKYRPAPFQAAIDAGARVVPVVVRYRFADGQVTTNPAFVGDATLWQSVSRVISMRGLVIEVEALPTIKAGSIGHTDRRQLAAEVERAVDRAVELSLEVRAPGHSVAQVA
ncbi:1-acyl-sn-glycerol-3-phosphate acyltransferase [Pseudonocardiaceae bacterium YIM PH 21723]|nr:1-acyl-sn-glycerol-3-phosphate acyltransferase [Pseudonocardiaceae bacterium YIM PH 21723]